MFIAKSSTSLLIFFIFLLTDHSRCDDALGFKSHPAIVGVVHPQQGRPLTIVCTTNGPAAIHWTIGGVRLSNTTRRHYSSGAFTSSELVITRVDRAEDSGDIVCEAIAASSPDVVKSRPLSLDIAWLENPSVELEQPENASEIVTGAEVVLICEADLGSGDIQFHWFRNAEQLLQKEASIEIKKNRLRIKKVSAMDNGVYRCSVHLETDTKESTSNFVLTIVDASLPQITVQPKDLLSIPKSSAMFDCQYKMADSVEWFKNDMNLPFENGERIIIHKNGSLVIKNITRRDEGSYSCVAFKNQEKTPSQKYSARLKVAYSKPLSIQELEPQVSEMRIAYGREGSEFQLTCLPPHDSFPVPNIMWKNTDQHLISDAGPVRVDDGSLIIDSLTRSHQGVFTCVSENIAGSHEISVFLIVNPSPIITLHPVKTTVNENEPSEFKCDFNMEKLDGLRVDLKKFWNKIVNQNYLKILNGKPQHSKKHSGEREFPQNLAHMGNFSLSSGEIDTSTERQHMDNGVVLKKEQVIEKWMDEFNWNLFEFKWKKSGGKTVKEEQGRVTVLPMVGELKFEKTFVSDKSQYWCEVSTPAGIVVRSQAAQLSIKEMLKFSPMPVSKKLELNTPGKVHCRAQGTPTPTVTWFQLFDSALPEDSQSINGTLQFAKVMRGHKGNYTCVASSSQGTIQATVLVDVVVSPRFISPLPSQVFDVTEGDSVWMDCIAEGDPTPKTQWDRNLHTINVGVQTEKPEINEDDDDSSKRPSLDEGDANGDADDDNDRLRLLENGTLFIRSVRSEDSDHYGCTAGNSAGLRREEVILIVHVIGDVVGEVNEDGVITKAILITMSVVGAYMLLVIGLMLWCRIRRRRKREQNQDNEKLENGDLELKDKDGAEDKLIENHDDNNEILSENLPLNKKHGSNGNAVGRGGGAVNRSNGCAAKGLRSHPATASDNSQASARSLTDTLKMSRAGLGDFVPLGRGEFGDVILAKWTKESSPQQHETVMLKSLLQTRDESHLGEFKRQMDLFTRVKHESVARLIGLCSDGEPHYLVFEYTDWGDLKQFLLATRTDEEILAAKDKKDKDHPIKDSSDLIAVNGHDDQIITSSQPEVLPEEKRKRTAPLLVPQCLGLAHQISKAMECISDCRMVHKDVATRNCIISSKFQVKVSIPALTKDTYSKEYCKHMNQVIPLRWLPQECVYDSDYSTKSDVYMFACTVWEIFHKAELPFIKMSDSTVLSHLKNNTLKWKTHPDMPQDLIDLLEKCWDVSPKVRPSFTEITRLIAKILTESKNAIAKSSN